MTEKYKGDIEIALDKALEKSERVLREGGKDYPVTMIVGPTGSGKTPRVLQWAKDEGVNLFHVQCACLRDEDIYGMMWRAEDGTEKQFASGFFDNFGTAPRSVLFLDDFDKASLSVREALITLMDEHSVPDCRLPGGKRFIDFLFTVTASIEDVPTKWDKPSQTKPPNAEEKADEIAQNTAEKSDYKEFLDELLASGNWIVYRDDEEGKK